ncbi:MAG TPA: DUF2510 domain-containing protein [Jatrophihabitans sp.]|nr:DUF2510 domain-containing protein [Jatrophihabitans sp.]
MAEPGWYPDPQDPASEAYYDGATWTGVRRPLPAPPLVWQAPVPEWNAPAAWQPQWQTPPPQRRRRRTPLILAVVAIAAVAAGVLTWQLWPQTKPQITYEGKSVAAPDRVLTKAEAVLRDYVRQQHGATNGTTRCYFSKPTKPAADAKQSDVTTTLLCGPVLFVDGNTAYPYVEMRLTTDDATTTGPVTLTPPHSLSDVHPEALAADVLLVRPDGKTAPSGAGGLTVPDPPPAGADVLTSAQLGQVPTPPSLDSARMVGKNTGVVLEAAGVIPRYGLGADARSAPPGQQLIAFQLSYTAGDVSGTGSGSAQLVVDGGAPRKLPVTSGGDEWDVVAIDKAASAVLQLSNGGYTQTLSLPGGKPGAHNLAVLARRHRSEVLHRRASIPVHFSNGVGSADATFHARASYASIDFWIPGHTAKHASDPGHAILSMRLNYTDSANPGHTFGFDPQLLRLRLPDGHTIRARNVAHAHFIFDVFEVPAGFTRGTVQISGSEHVQGVTVTVRRTASIPLAIPAG